MRKTWPVNFTKQAYQGERYPYWSVDVRDANNNPVTGYQALLVLVRVSNNSRVVEAEFEIGSGLEQEGSVTTLKADVPEDMPLSSYEPEWRITTPGGLKFKMGPGFFTVIKSFTNG